MTKVQEYLLKALKEAIQMEVDGREFYLQAAKKVKNEGVRQILDYLAESEVYHIKKFNEIYQNLEKDPTWTEKLAEFKPPHSEPYACVMAMTQADQGAGGKDDLEALKTGLKMDSYESLMEGTIYGPVVLAGDSQRSILNMMAEGRAGKLRQIMHDQGIVLSDDEIMQLKLWVDQGAQNN